MSMKIDWDLLGIAVLLQPTKPAQAKTILGFAIDCEDCKNFVIDWDLLGVAMEMHDTKPQAAIQLVQSAVSCDSQKGCCQGNETCDSGDKPTVTGEKSVVYGKGLYTDSQDVRDQNARGFTKDQSGKYTGVNTLVKVQPGTKYKCVNVKLLPLDESCNIYIHVYDKNGNELAGDDARLTTGDGEGIDKLYRAGNPNRSFAMGRASKVWEPNLGGCGAAVVDASENIISDIVSGLGLFGGNHMSYFVSFRER